MVTSGWGRMMLMSYLKFTIRKYTEEMDNMMLLSNQGKMKKSHNIAVSDTLWSILVEINFISKTKYIYACVCEREKVEREDL